MKDLAVLIPSYNDTPALLKTLASIREKDNRFTVVVVDDGSREPVEVDSASYPFRVEVIRQPQNGGIVKALNTGIEFIRREGFTYLARLDAADLNRPGRFQQQYDRLLAEPALAMVGSNVVYLDEESNEPLFTTQLPITPTDTRRWMVFRNCFIHPSVMLPTAILEKTGDYDAAFPHIEDYVLFSRVVEAGDAVNIEEPLVDCYVRREGISCKNQRKQLVAGLKFKLRHPRLLDPLWYAFLAKRTCYLVTPFAIRNRLKNWLGFVKTDRPPSVPSASPVQEV